MTDQKPREFILVNNWDECMFVTGVNLQKIEIPDSVEKIHVIEHSAYAALKEENEKIQRRNDVLERVKRIWERRSFGDANDLMDASQEAQHYNWLDEQNAKIRAENKRLLTELNLVKDVICSEFCGREHHEQCNRVSKALRGADEN